MRWAGTFSSVALALSLAASAAGQARRALLIGINTYQPPATSAQHPGGCSGGRCDLPVFENLDGALNDVAAMRDLLASPKFGFSPSAVAVLTNPALPASQLPYVTVPAAQTSRDGILAAMQKYLVDVPQPGDMVVFYYAGHGSLRLNSKGTKLTLTVGGRQTHADSTLVASDAWTGAYDVRDREMTRIFHAALDKGIHLTVILDSCHSGAFTRGVPIGPPVKSRMLPYDPRDIAEDPDLAADGKPRPAPAERADNPALIFSAAQQDQTAKEASPTDTQPEAHGAFTQALLHALQALPADAPASVVYQQVRAQLEGEGVEDQAPSLDAAATRREQPLFGGTTTGQSKLRAAVVAVNDDGTLTLDTGRLAGVGPGSTFVSFGVAGKAQQVTLKVTDLLGLARAKAAILAPPQAQPELGSVFELDSWVPAPVDPLRFWTWPASLNAAQIASAVAVVRASGVAIVSDPAEQPWTHMLLWNGFAWQLQSAGQPAPVDLGASLTAAALRKAAPADAKLWVNLPPPSELASHLALAEPGSMVQGVADVALADYLLTGSLAANGPAWAWYRKADFALGPPAANAPRHSPGCSPRSSYPVRTDWIGAAPDVSAPAAKLNDYAARLAKLAAWLRLPSSPGGSADDYYRLGFQRVADSTLLPEGQVVHQGDRLRLALTTSTRVLEKRWVYILDVDCHGEGTLIYPHNYSENRFPNDASDPRQIVLPGSPIVDVSAPFGQDTLLLISTTEPLSDPYLLNFKGVASRGGVSRPQSPLERLLAGASSGTRGLQLNEVPTNWAVSVTGLRSEPVP